jgi:hypothetical protein
MKFEMFWYRYQAIGTLLYLGGQLLRVVKWACEWVANTRRYKETNSIFLATLVKTAKEIILRYVFFARQEEISSEFFSHYIYIRC